MRYTAAIVYLQRSLAVVYITLLKGVFCGVPLPEVCLSRRGDRNAPDTISRDCTNTERVHRFFFSARRLRCKKFSLCPSLAVYLDEQCDADNISKAGRTARNLALMVSMHPVSLLSGCS